MVTSNIKLSSILAPLQNPACVGARRPCSSAVTSNRCSYTTAYNFGRNNITKIPLLFPGSAWSPPLYMLLTLNLFQSEGIPFLLTAFNNIAIASYIPLCWCYYSSSGDSHESPSNLFSFINYMAFLISSAENGSGCTVGIGMSSSGVAAAVVDYSNFL